MIRIYFRGFALLFAGTIPFCQIAYASPTALADCAKAIKEGHIGEAPPETEYRPNWQPHEWNQTTADRFAHGLTPEAVEENRLSGPEPSHAITLVGDGPVLKGVFEPEVKGWTKKGLTLVPKGKPMILGGKPYSELTNGSIFKTTDSSGKEHTFLLARAVPPYEVLVKPDGTLEPINYRSDFVLFEQKPNGKFEYVKTLIEAIPELNYYPEDPRVVARGNGENYLCFTDYSPHVKEWAGKNRGKTIADPDVVNVSMKMEIDSHGVPISPTTNKATGRPLGLRNLSPVPKIVEGRYLFIDAKNTTYFENRDGTVSVRLRVRPNFKDPRIQKMAGHIDWGDYSIQTLKFKNWEDSENYNYNYVLHDLFGVEHPGGVKPLVAKMLYRGKDIIRSNPDPRLVLVHEDGVTRPKIGLGPGAQVVAVVRRGNQLFLDQGLGSELLPAGTIPEALQKDFIVKDGSTYQIAMDHDIQWFIKDGLFVRRHYEGAMVLYNADGTEVLAYYSGALPPRDLHELGIGSGVSDLNNMYAMSRTMEKVPETGQYKIRYSVGTGDANVSLVDVNVVNILTEMSDPKRWATKQIFVPGKP